MKMKVLQAYDRNVFIVELTRDRNHGIDTEPPPKNLVDDVLELVSDLRDMGNSVYGIDYEDEVI